MCLGVADPKCYTGRTKKKIKYKVGEYFLLLKAGR